jgi:hypothetical protein
MNEGTSAVAFGRRCAVCVRFGCGRPVNDGVTARVAAQVNPLRRLSRVEKFIDVLAGEERYDEAPLQGR